MEQSSNRLEKAIEKKSGTTLQLLSHHDTNTSSNVRESRAKSFFNKVYACPDLNTMTHNQNRSDSWSYGGMNWSIARQYYLPHEIVNGFISALAYTAKGQLIPIAISSTVY